MMTKKPKAVKPLKAWGILNTETNMLCAWVFPAKQMPFWADNCGGYKSIPVLITPITRKKK